MLQQQQQASLQDYQDDNAAFNNANRPEIKAHNPTPRAKSSKLAAIEKMFPNFRKRNPINPNKTFENYVIDPENKTLFATAIAVATNPGSSNYNPLYIYGASGLGKTHLLFAIANRIMQLNSDISIIYTRAEEFIRHYVESMASIKKSPFDDQQVHFQDLYTEHDVFIVDDIQNFIKGPKARDAFFDIIAEFIDKPNRQLILASDVPPGNLNGFNVIYGLCFFIFSIGKKANFHIWSIAPLLTHMFLSAPFLLRSDTGVFCTIEKALRSNLRRLLIRHKEISHFSL